MGYITARQKLLLTASFVTLVIVILTYGGIVLQLGILQDIKLQYDALSKESSRIRGLKAHLKELSSDAKFIDEHAHVLQRFFLAETDIVEFIGRSEEIAKKHDLIISISSQQSTRSIPGMAFQFSLWGPFPRVMRFLSQLSHGAHLVTIDQVRMAFISDREIEQGIRGKQLKKGDIQATVILFIPTRK